MPNGGLQPSLSSNIKKVIAETRTSIRRFPEEIDKAVGQNAVTVLRESIVEIDALIYGTPPAPTYKRTKNLRRANQIRRQGPLAWLMFNDAKYAGAVHDGTSRMPPRPWIQNAIDRKEKEMEENLVNGGLNAFREGHHSQGPAVPQGEVTQGEDASE